MGQSRHLGGDLSHRHRRRGLLPACGSPRLGARDRRLAAAELRPPCRPPRSSPGRWLGEPRHPRRRPAPPGPYRDLPADRPPPLPRLAPQSRARGIADAMELAPEAFVIVIGGTSGAGKSSLVRRTAELLGDAVTLHFDDYKSVSVYPDA